MPGPPKSFLIVSDNPLDLVSLGTLLEPFGHFVQSADGGRRAIELFESTAPDLLLCDLAMPGCDGIEVLSAVRSHPTRSHTPVIILTSQALREQRVRALQAGADDFLEKPIDVAVLAARVLTLLRLKHARDELHRAHVELHDRHATLERLQREQRELSEFIVHDLRAPLTAMQLSLSWCRDVASGGGAIDDALEDCVLATRRLAGLVEDLSWVGHLERADFPVTLATMPLSPLVEDVVRRHRALFVAQRVDVELDATKNATVRADGNLLRRVLDNLLDNGSRQSAGGGRMRVSVAEDPAIVVSNDGPGIPATERDRIFEKLTSGSTGRPGKSGLGLYFCRRAMRAQDGDVDVVDVAGWPTSFRVRLAAAPHAP